MTIIDSNRVRIHLLDHMSEISLRRLSTQDEYEACVTLQKVTWGNHFAECVPPAILQIGQKIGGVTAGAFDKNNDLVGFVFGLTGLKDNTTVHWSHMLAVRRAWRGKGIGLQLKLFQRQLILELGINWMYWTYDPLVAKNAHLNFNKLGVVVCQYVENMYGDDTGSDLHHGLGLDRLVVEWPIATEHVQKTISGERPDLHSQFHEAPVVNTNLGEDGHPMPVHLKLPSSPLVRIEIPQNIEEIQKQSLDLAALWRNNTKRAFVHYFNLGFEVTTFYRDTQSGRCYYGLSRNPSLQHEHGKSTSNDDQDSKPQSV